MSRTVDLWLDLRSPYSYLAKDPAYALEQELGVTLRLRPFALNLATIANLNDPKALQSAERSSEDYVLGRARFTLGVALAHRASPAERERGLAVLGQVREMCLEGRFYRFSLAAVDIYTALERARCGDRDSAISQMRAAIDDMFHSGHLWYGIPATARISFGLYNTRADVDAAIPALHEVRKLFG